MTQTTTRLTATVKDQQYRQEIKRIKQEAADRIAELEVQNLEWKQLYADAQALAKFYYNFINEQEKKNAQ